MPLTLSVFAIAGLDGNVTFCYAQFRTRHASSIYARPSLPLSVGEQEVEKHALGSGKLELWIWDAILDDKESLAAKADLANGQLRLPDRCPILPGEILAGVRFADRLLTEREGRMLVEGAGELRSRGFALGEAAAEIVGALRSSLNRKTVGDELNALVKLIDREAGVKTLLDPICRLGIVEHLLREGGEKIPFPIVAEVVKSDARSLEPCRTLLLTRTPSAAGKDLSVAIEARSGDAVVLDRLVNMPDGSADVRLDAGTHVTSLMTKVFDAQTGEPIDREEMVLVQSISIGLIGQVAMDILTPPFRAAHAAVDLVKRRRISTSTVAIGGEKRSGGLDVVKANGDVFEALAGSRSWKPETRFFSPGADPQIEVIRWIKKKIEAAEVTEAFLIDPFLGSEALHRVVLRQGNESVKLTVLVSPGDIDPDAAATDVKAEAGGHVANLIKAADAVAHALCGDIEIVHVRRGGGTRQAFHDRYLGLTRRDGTPQVFLLSNSLSKAAGDWPFAAVEMDTPTAWRVADYIAGLLVGDDGSGRDLRAETVWRSAGRKGSATSLVASTPPSAFIAASWAAYMKLHELGQKERLEERSLTDPIVDNLIAEAPSSFETKVLADFLVDSVGGRDFLIPVMTRRLLEIPRFADVARAMEDAAFERQLARLEPSSGLFGLPAAISELGFVGELLARRPKGTDLLRNRVNPRADEFARSVEIGRTMADGLSRLIAGLGLVIIGLRLASAKSRIPVQFRNGIAIDYIHLLGRLLRSPVSRFLFEESPRGRFPGVELAYEAIRIVGILKGDPTLNIMGAVETLAADPFVPIQLKTSDFPEPDV